MKFDLHCHTKEGSFDSNVSVYKYVSVYHKLGYDGFMIADHNSYRGCKEWDKIKHLPECRDFTVIRGIEYDTKDAGHVLIVMPDGVYLPLLRVRGMRFLKLIHVVHSCGGVLGLAHPYGVKSSSAMGFKLMREELIAMVDFIETFNTCESHQSNLKATKLAKQYQLPQTAGTDAHREEYIGMAYTEIDATIKSNNDFIKAIKNKVNTDAIGTEREETRRSRAKEGWTGILGYKAYNRGIAKTRMAHRKISHYRLTHNSDLAHLFKREWKEVNKKYPR